MHPITTLLALILLTALQVGVLPVVVSSAFIPDLLAVLVVRVAIAGRGEAASAGVFGLLVGAMKDQISFTPLGLWAGVYGLFALWLAGGSLRYRPPSVFRDAVLAGLVAIAAGAVLMVRALLLGFVGVQAASPGIGQVAATGAMTTAAGLIVLALWQRRGRRRSAWA